MQIEILNWAVRVATRDSAVPAPPATPKLTGRSSRLTAPARSPCDVDGSAKQAAFVARADLKPGDHVPGPALIDEPQTTTLVSADFSAHLEAIGNLVLVKTPSSSEAVGETKNVQKGGAK